MADIAVTANAVEPVFPERAIIRSYLAAATIAKGQSVYQDANGFANLASSAAAGTRQFLGLALNPAAPGQAVDVIHEGEVAGLNLSTIAYDGFVYLSDTAGNLADAAGTTAVRVGRVVSRSDPTQTKLADIRRDWNNNW